MPFYIMGLKPHRSILSICKINGENQTIFEHLSNENIELVKDQQSISVEVGLIFITSSGI